MVVVKHTALGGGGQISTHITLFCLYSLSPGFLSSGKPDFDSIV